MITVRSQYAVVLAYFGRFSDAETEMARLEPYQPGLTPLVQRELENQRELIAQLRRYGPPQKWLPPPSQIGNSAKYPGGMVDDGLKQMRSGKQKVGRNGRHCAARPGPVSIRRNRRRGDGCNRWLARLIGGPSDWSYARKLVTV